MLLTSCYQLIALDYSSAVAARVVTTSSVSIKEPHARPSDLQTIRLDPQGRCLIVHAYNGLIRVVPLEPEERGRRGSKSSKRASISITPGMEVDEDKSVVIDLSRSYNVGLQTLNVTDLDFLPLASVVGADPTLVLVFSDYMGRKVLQSHVLDLPSRELLEGPLEDTILADQGSELVIPVKLEGEGEEGVIVIGEESLRWVPLPSEDTAKGKGKLGGEGSVECSMPVGLIQAYVPPALSRAS